MSESGTEGELRLSSNYRRNRRDFCRGSRVGSTAGLKNQASTSAPLRFANASIAARCRFSLSLSAPTLGAEDVRM